MKKVKHNKRLCKDLHKRLDYLFDIAFSRYDIDFKEKYFKESMGFLKTILWQSEDFLRKNNAWKKDKERYEGTKADLRKLESDGFFMKDCILKKIETGKEHEYEEMRYREIIEKIKYVKQQIKDMESEVKL